MAGQAVETMQRQAPQFDAIVIGLGKTGAACLRYLRGRGLAVAAADTRPDAPFAAAARRDMPELEIRAGGLDGEWLCRARQLVVSPGVAVAHPAIRRARRAGVEITGDIELFARAWERPVIAITGSNGKSTVTRLVEAMGRAAGIDIAAAGNIGTPALELLGDGAPGCCALELSSFQLETTDSLRPAVATVLNVSHDHMDRYRSFEDYRAAKQRVYRGAAAIVVNRDDAHTAPRRSAARRFSFGLDQPAGAEDFGLVRAGDGIWLARGDARLLDTAALRLSGRHNWANVLAALAIAAAAGWALRPCLEAAARFAGLPHRMEPVAERGGVRWVNDSKATNVGAAAAALAGAAAPVVLIAGGDGKGADFTPLRPAVARHARAVILFGRDAALIERALDGIDVERRRAATLTEAVQAAAAVARPGDTVLLSPACASLDMFRDYEHRGDAFRAAVEALS